GIVASGVARRSNTPVCSTPRALLASRIGALGAPGYFAAGPKRGGAAGRTRPKPTARGGRALGLTRWCPTRTRQRIRSLIVGLDSGRLAFLPHWSRRPICLRCLLILSRWYRSLRPSQSLAVGCLALVRPRATARGRRRRTLAESGS